MALVQHIPPHIATRLHAAGLLSEQAKLKIAHRSRLVMRIWAAIALTLVLTVWGFRSLTAATPSNPPNSPTQQTHAS